MIDTTRSRELHIKRANTDWWINEPAMVGNNGKTYIAYFTDMGEIHVKEIDAKCSRALSHDVCLCRLNCNFADEHNAPSLCVLENGTIIVAYTGHAATQSIRYRITERPYDIFSFGPEYQLDYDGDVTYVQLSENRKRNELWMFSRVNRVTWEFRTSQDEGKTWNKASTFLISNAGGLFYFNVRKQWKAAHGIPTSEQWVFALYGHPLQSADNTIRSGIFDSDGNLLSMNGEPLGVNLFAGDKIDLSTLDVVYESPKGTTVRLLAVAPTMPYRVGLASFCLDEPDSICYYTATWKPDGWMLSEPIATGGEFLSLKTMRDGSATYVGGMAYYYGVGEAGLNEIHTFVAPETNRVYIARFDGEARVLESYLSQDCGKTYKKEQILRRFPKEENKKIWRPIVPIYAQDNLPVYWHEGSYGAHTGGWHCDEVMFVEYDD